jgi:hypothetical protein
LSFFGADESVLGAGAGVGAGAGAGAGAGEGDGAATTGAGVGFLSIPPRPLSSFSTPDIRTPVIGSYIAASCVKSVLSQLTFFIFSFQIVLLFTRVSFFTFRSCI